MRKYLCLLDKVLKEDEVVALEKNSCLFVDDVGASIEVECGFCHETFILEEKEKCPHCEKDIIMGRYDW
jgi:hypothetical protein